MSKSAKAHIENAAEIIEAFGGIRPMSAKINVAVTTIQGWKKRDVIPAARRGMLLEAGAANDVDLSKFFADAPAIEVVGDSSNDDKDASSEPAEITIPDNLDEKHDEEAGEKSIVDEQDTEEAKEDKSDDNDKTDDVIDIPLILANEGKPVLKSASVSNVNSPKDIDAGDLSGKPADYKDFAEIAMRAERKAITKSVIIAVAIFLLVVAGLVALLFPDFKEFGNRGSRLAALEGDVSNIKDSQSAFKGFVPEDWSKQLNDLKSQVDQAKSSMESVAQNAKEISADIMNEKGLEERVVQLQSYVTEIASENGIYALLSRFDNMENDPNGRNIIDSSMSELSDILAGMKGEDESYLNAALAVARSENEALQQTLGSVPQNELKAAAMLLAMTQVRSSLNRSDEAFDQDLGILMNMVGPENPELSEALAKLAPHSKAGILSPAGLQSEFRTVAGDVVAASLSGEDVSFSEKASARMNEILQVEKDGELITGTDTQATVNNAGSMIDSGDISGAMSYLKSNLRAKELEPLRPWLRKAEAAINSRKAQKVIQQAIDMSVGGGFLGGSQLLNGSSQ